MGGLRLEREGGAKAMMEDEEDGGETNGRRTERSNENKSSQLSQKAKGRKGELVINTKFLQSLNRVDRPTALSTAHAT